MNGQVPAITHFGVMAGHLAMKNGVSGTKRTIHAAVRITSRAQSTHATPALMTSLAFASPMGGFKGTAIKPTYLMRKATEVFGPCGEGWGWTVLEDRFDESAPLQAPTKEWPDAPRINAKLHTLKIELWYLGKEAKNAPFNTTGTHPSFSCSRGKS